ncbi:hypothetical protein RIVM261_074530 [Rivularia sp. IAM M-261]|nr:hypothetical protein RIVM261_074530 [Rivularia sp. IAM M-261]
MSYQRPVVFISESTQDRRVSDIAIAGLVVLFVVAIYGWFVLPDTIPMHFGFDGRPNAWGSKRILWMLPGLALFFYGFLTYLNRTPHKFNYLVPINENNARRQYAIALSMLNWLKVELIWIFAFMQCLMYSLATSQSFSWGIWFVPVFFLVVLGTVTYWLRQSLQAR